MSHTPDHLLENARLIKAQLIIFILAFFLPIMLFPFVDEHLADTVGKMIDMLFITGTILLAVKLAREGWDLAAAGFTVLGIGWGVLFAAIDFNQLDLDTEVRTSAAFFFIPSMVLIAYYKPFPWWIKAMTLWCIVPFTISFISQKAGPENHHFTNSWVLWGFNSFHLTSVFWAAFFYRTYRQERKSRLALAEVLENPSS